MLAPPPTAATAVAAACRLMLPHDALALTPPTHLPQASPPVMADQQQHSLTVRLPPELADKLARLAAVQGSSPEETLVWELRRALAGVSLGAPAGGSGDLGAALGRAPSGRVHCGSTLARQESARLYTTAPVRALAAAAYEGASGAGREAAGGAALATTAKSCLCSLFLLLLLPTGAVAD